VKLWKGSDDPKAEGIQKALHNEAEAFCHFVDNYELPEECRSVRFGVATWQHPINIEAADLGNPSEQVAEVIGEILEKGGEAREALFGKDKRHSTRDVWEILHGACGGEGPMKLAKDPTALGHYLRHAKKKADRNPGWGFHIETVKYKGHTRWVFKACDE
jgi:hypothetical protein